MKHSLFILIVTFFLFPSLSFSQQILCQESAGQETYSVIPSDINNTFLWSSTSGLTFSSTNSTSTDVDWTNMPAGNYNISFTETNAQGCDSTVTLSVTINSSPTLAITTVVVCEGATSSSVFANISGGLSPYTVDWGQPTGNTELETLDLSLVGAGYDGSDISSTLDLLQIVTVTDANGCIGTLNENIVDVVPTPEPGAITF